MQERYTFLSSLYEVMEGNGVAIGDETRTAANMIVKVQRVPVMCIYFSVFSAEPLKSLNSPPYTNSK